MPTTRRSQIRIAALIVAAATAVVFAWFLRTPDVGTLAPLAPATPASPMRGAEPPGSERVERVSMEERVALETDAAHFQLTLRARDCAGRGAADVPIEVRAAERLIASTRTDAGGSASLSLPARTLMTLRASSGTAIEVERNVLLQADRELDLVLERPGTFVRGRVTGPREGVRRCRVVCIPDSVWDPRPEAVDALLAQRDVRTTDVDADGRFAFCSLVPGRYHLAVGGHGFRPRWPPPNFDTRPNEIEFVIDLEEVFGAVVELCAEDGGPLRISELVDRLSSGCAFEIPAGFEDAPLDLLQSALAGLPARVSAHHSFATFIAAGPGELPATGRVRATAATYDDAEADVPLERLDRVAPFRIAMHSRFANRGRVIVELSGLPPCASSVAGREGALECTLRPTERGAPLFFHLEPTQGRQVVIEGIPFGAYEAFLRGPGRDAGAPSVREKRTIEVTETDVHWPVDLSDSGCIRLRVLRGDGSEFRGDVYVTLQRSTSERSRSIGFSRPDYVVRALPAGSYHVRIETPREARPSETDLVVRAGEETSFECTVVR